MSVSLWIELLCRAEPVRCRCGRGLSSTAEAVFLVSDRASVGYCSLRCCRAAIGTPPPPFDPEGANLLTTLGFPGVDSEREEC